MLIRVLVPYSSVPQFVKGELSPEKHDAFEKELKNNQELQLEVEEYSALYNSYSDLPSKLPEPPADSFSKILSKIDAEEKKQTQTEIKNNYSDIIQALRNFLPCRNYPGQLLQLS